MSENVFNIDRQYPFTEDHPYITDNCKYWVKGRLVHFCNEKESGGIKISSLIDKALAKAYSYNDRTCLELVMQLGLFAAFSDEQRDLRKIIENNDHKIKGHKFSKNKESDFLANEIWCQVNYYKGKKLGSLEKIYNKVGENLSKSEETIATIHKKLNREYKTIKKSAKEGTIPKEIFNLHHREKFYYLKGRQDLLSEIDIFEKSR